MKTMMKTKVLSHQVVIMWLLLVRPSYTVDPRTYLSGDLQGSFKQKNHDTHTPLGHKSKCFFL